MKRWSSLTIGALVGLTGVAVALGGCGGTTLTEGGGGADPGERALPRPVAALLAWGEAAPVSQRGDAFVVRASASDATGRATLRAEVDVVDGSFAFFERDVELPLRVRRMSPSVPRSARVEKGALALEGVAQDVGARVFSTARGVEDLLIAERPGAALGYDVDLPDGWKLAQDAQSTVEVIDPLGSPRLRLVAARAWDAEGARVPVRVAIEDRARITIHIDDRAASYPIYVDPEVSLGTVPGFDRGLHTVTSTPDGRVLLIGGPGPTGPDSPYCEAESLPVEAFDVRTLRFDVLSDGLAPRCEHSATLLTNGEVLVVGGRVLEDGGPRVLDLIERVDALDGSLLGVAQLAFARTNHTATRLRDGRLLIVGGEQMGQLGEGVPLAETEIWDPTSATLSPGPPLQQARTQHTATLLPDGRVLVAGGHTGPTVPTGSLKSAEIFDPASDSWSSVEAQMTTRRTAHAATATHAGEVLLWGGRNDTTSALVQDRFDPSLATFSQGGGWVVGGPFNADRNMFFALPPSDDLVFGGAFNYSSGARGVLLPFGRVFTMEVPGFAQVGEMVDAADLYLRVVGEIQPRGGHTATVLPSGRILLAGGRAFWPDEAPPIRAQSVAEELDPVTLETAPVGPLTRERHDHSATLLRDGRVLVVGGASVGGADNRVSELYDPATRTFSEGPRLEIDRAQHTATLLPNGDVLIAGGSESGLVERYVSASGTFEVVGDLTQPRARHTATRLLDGRVVLAGGGTSLLELFDPQTNELTAAGTLQQVRTGHVSALLPDGTVLFIGGIADPPFPWTGANVEIWDPTTGTSREPLRTLRPDVPIGPGGQAVTLPSGDVLSCTNSGEGCTLCGGCWLYRPTLDAFQELPDASVRNGGTMTRALDGSVIMAGTFMGTEEYRQGTFDRLIPRPPVAAPPELSAYPAALASGAAAPLLGNDLVGRTEATNGTTFASAADHPIAIWMPAEDGVPVTGGLRDETPGSATWKAPMTSFHGLGSLYVSTAGAVSRGTPLSLLGVGLGGPCLSDAVCASNHCSDGVCCGSACGGCSACTASLKGSGSDGECGPLPTGAPPLDGGSCPAQPLSECGRTGVCDGEGECALVEDGTPCLEGAACLSGECTVAPSTCDGESTIIGAGQSVLECAPYRCSDDGPACLTACASALECSAGYVCSVDGECVEPGAPGERPDGCAVSPRGASRYPWTVAALGLALLMRRRRRDRIFCCSLLASALAATACDPPGAPVPDPVAGGAGGGGAGGGLAGAGGAGGEAKAARCGNGVREEAEECDGGDLSGASCETLGFQPGVPFCRHDCTLDPTSCVGCGNGYIDPGEECDGDQLGEETCLSQASPAWWLYISQWFEEFAAHESRVSGHLSCDSSCQLDSSTCGYCFDGVLNGDELCDDPDFAQGPLPPVLNGATCASVDPRFVGGTLRCGSCFGPEAYLTGQCVGAEPPSCAAGGNCSFVLELNQAPATLGAAEELGLSAGSLTVEGWFRVDQIAPCQLGVSRWQVNADPNDLEWAMVSEVDTLLARSRSAPGDPAAPFDQAEYFNGFEISSWFHLAAVFDRDQGETRLYVGGVLRDVAALAPGEVAAGLPVRLTQPCTVTHPWGRMDEVRISSLARYDADFTPQTTFAPDADTLALYHFDEGTGLTLIDSSGNARDVPLAFDQAGPLGGPRWAGEHP